MKNDLTLCIFIDALGWQLAEQSGFLSSLLVRQQPVETILGYSSTCAPTILTGRLPREHGHFAFYRFAPEASSFPEALGTLRWLPEAITGRARVRHLLSRAVKAAKGWEGYVQLYDVPFDRLSLLDYSEKRDLFEPGGINGGCPTIFDRLRERRVPFHKSDWRAPESARIEALRTELQRGQIEFAYLYLADLDGILHMHGTSGSSVEAKIRWYERQIEQLVLLAERHHRNVRLLVFSDHGMHDVHDTSNLMLRVEALGFEWGRDYAAVWDSTLARFWFLDDRARATILATLRSERRGRVLDRSELAVLGLDFPGDEYGELFFLMNPGVLLCPSFMGRRPIAGMHGYHPSDGASAAMFGSNDPNGITPSRLDDLYDTMLEGVAA